MLVPGCGLGHEAALLVYLGYEVIGLDFSSEAIQRAQAAQGSDRAQLRWLQADFFDGGSLAAAGITTGSLQGVLDPAQRESYLDTVARLLAPGCWPPVGQRPGIAGGASEGSLISPGTVGARAGLSLRAR